jgi:uncharacterized protein with HEPN domain
VLSEKQRESLRDIVENIDRIVDYVGKMPRQDYEQDQMRVDAVERCLQRITEAGFRLGDRALELLPMHNWKDIRAVGNRLRHGYDTLKRDVIWQVITADLPALKHDCVHLLEGLETDEGTSRS